MLPFFSDSKCISRLPTFHNIRLADQWIGSVCDTRYLGEDSHGRAQQEQMLFIINIIIVNILPKNLSCNNKLL